ncbi:MAG: membrane dipeptidase [Bacteroidota bacterium]
MRYTDLHVHVSLKTMLGKGSDSGYSCWKEVNVSGAIDFISRNTFDSQSSLSQMARGNCSIAVAALYPLETKLADVDLLQILARLVEDRKFANKRLQDIKHHKWTSFNYANDELDHILSDQLHTIDGKQKRLKVLSNWTDFNPGDPDTLHIVFTLEGGHSLTYGRNENADISKMLENLRHFRRRIPLLYFTMAHMQQMVFANHAYGMKSAGKYYFVPRGSGLTDHGRKLIDECYTDRQGKKVLVDVKHMSLRSRFDFYMYRKQMEYENIPIIASHVGVTGISKDNHRFIKKLVQPFLRKFYKLVHQQVPGMIEGTFFNPSTINMYDEDIVEILKSDGIIGISFDIRIIGGKHRPPKEFMSSYEEYLFNSTTDSDLIVSNNEADFQDEEGDDNLFEENEIEIAGDKGVLHFANQVLHILRTGNTAGIDATNHIAIGTDFDGLIASLPEVPDASMMPEFAEKLIKVFERCNLQTFTSDNALDLVEKIMNKNTERFIERWIKNLY